MVKNTLFKNFLAASGIIVFLTACQLEVTQNKNAEAPVFSIEGAVDYNDAVTITTATEGAEIFYTTDGSDPTASSTEYTAPVAITADCTIKAVAVKEGMQNSIITSKSFTIKKYTVTFDSNGHGTAPNAISGKRKGENITLPTALNATGFLFKNWSDGTNDFAAGASYIVTGDVTIKAVWKEIPNVTNLTAKCTASGTVKLTWTNPADADFAKVVITYEPGNGNVTVAKTASPNNETTVTDLTDGTEYTFTVKSYDNTGNASSSESVKCFSGNGGLSGTPKNGQTQGAVLEGSLKETWMADSGNLKINETEIAKTSEVIVVPAGTVAVVTMTDDSSWNGYYQGSWAQGKGAFIANRKVKLDPFVMSQYEVTQKLYEEVIGNNPSYFPSSPGTGETQENRPVEQVTWYQACAFCNELTKKTFGDEAKEYVYYSDSNLSTPYTKDDADNKTTPYIAYDTTNKKWTKKGYRLPTEAEWEFAARGGKPNKPEWKYKYAGLEGDTNLDNYCWYMVTSDHKTHEVGKKEKNTLNIYDMSGNVFEWCYDWYYHTEATIEDESYKTTDGYVQNPVVVSTWSFSSRCKRGGYYDLQADQCTVSFRYDSNPDYVSSYNGIRVCRSIEITN